MISLNSYKAVAEIRMAACCDLGFVLISLKWLLSQQNHNLETKEKSPSVTIKSDFDFKWPLLS